MLKNMADKIWARHLAVALGYAASYGLLREVSISHWMLFSGFRLCMLILLPYRYWPALAVGEMVPLGFLAVQNADRFGWMWAVGMLVPPIALAMPMVRYCREQRRLFPARTLTSMNVLLLCALVSSIVWAAVDFATLMLIELPPDFDAAGAPARYFLGSYIGILTVVPLALAVREALLERPLRQIWARLPRSRLAMETATLLLPSLVLLVWLALVSTSDTRQAARVAMFLPVAWLSLRHGWRGAAVGGTAASIAVILTMPARGDQGILQAETFIAFAVTTMLMLGARIALLNRRKEQNHVDARLALGAAQRNVYLGELQLRQASRALEQMSAAVQASCAQLLGSVRSLPPGTEEQTYYREAIGAQHRMWRLADALYPSSWHEHGLRAALREGAIPRALGEAGVGYRCDIGGQGLDGFSTNFQMAVFRLATEAIGYACAKRNVSTIRLRLRAGRYRGRRWVVLCVDGLVDYECLARVRWDEVWSALGCGAKDLEAIKDRARIFEGKAHVRALAQGARLSMIVYEPQR